MRDQGHFILVKVSEKNNSDKVHIKFCSESYEVYLKFISSALSSPHQKNAQ